MKILLLSLISIELSTINFQSHQRKSNWCLIKQIHLVHCKQIGTSTQFHFKENWERKKETKNWIDNPTANYLVTRMFFSFSNDSFIQKHWKKCENFFVRIQIWTEFHFVSPLKLVLLQVIFVKHYKQWVNNHECWLNFRISTFSNGKWEIFLCTNAFGNVVLRFYQFWSIAINTTLHMN